MKMAYTATHNEGHVFDLYGDLEDAYEKAKACGETEIVDTLDAFGLWDDRDQVPAKFFLRAWHAISGNASQQRELAWCFDRDGGKPKGERNPCYDRPQLAIFWYEKAAKAGDALAQNNLAHIYCTEDDMELWDGRLGAFWYEKAAAQKLPEGMRGLARCLECGMCLKDGADPARAKALFVEAEAIERGRREEGE